MVSLSLGSSRLMSRLRRRNHTASASNNQDSSPTSEQGGAVMPVRTATSAAIPSTTSPRSPRHAKNSRAPRSAQRSVRSFFTPPRAVRPRMQRMNSEEESKSQELDFDTEARCENETAYSPKTPVQQISKRRDERTEAMNVFPTTSIPKDDSQLGERGPRAGSTASLDDVIEKRRLHSVNSASGMSQIDLRATIREVQMDATLTPQEKTKKVQEVMSFSWQKTQKKANSASLRKRSNSTKSLQGCRSAASLQGGGSSRERLLSNASLVGSEYESVDGEEYDDLEDYDDECCITYSDEKKGILGCSHYERKCHISAPCCGEFFCCRFCHDEICYHEIVRTEIDRVRCMGCGHIQGVSESCEQCDLRFARYFCAKCKFYDDKEGKHIYHCDKCEICRIGRGLEKDYFHCDKCNACMSITLKDHKCIEKSLESDCPVCFEFLFTSTTPVMFLPCGHYIHAHCYEEYTKTNFTCPICRKSLGDMTLYFQRIDLMLAAETMPDEYLGVRSLIFCNDCEQRSVAPFHFMYHKCKCCRSYNTKMIEQIPVGVVHPLEEAANDTITTQEVRTGFPRHEVDVFDDDNSLETDSPGQEVDAHDDNSLETVSPRYDDGGESSYAHQTVPDDGAQVQQP